MIVFAFMPKETLDVAVAAARITPTDQEEYREFASSFVQLAFGVWQ